MSCFMVSEDCMGRVLNAAYLLGQNRKLESLLNVDVREGAKTCSTLWRVLYAVNQQAFHGRYNGRHAEESEIPPFDYTHATDAARAALTPAELIAHYKAVEAFVYQCAEDGVSEETYGELEAFRDAVKQLATLAWIAERGAMSRAALKPEIKNTPEYNSAAWG